MTLLILLSSKRSIDNCCRESSVDWTPLEWANTASNSYLRFTFVAFCGKKGSRCEGACSLAFRLLADSVIFQQPQRTRHVRPITPRGDRLSGLSDEVYDFENVT